MIQNDAIKQELKQKAEESALRTECQNCQTTGQWRVKVTEGVNLISKTRTSPAKRNFEEPVFLISVFCLVCGYAKTETVEVTK